MPKVIMLRIDAPTKPSVGALCNGCGVCCMSEPCPVGMLVSKRTQGACKALEFSEREGRYSCSLVSDPTRRLPRMLHWSAPLVSRFVSRFIAAGRGCDSDVEIQVA